jgi:hypothetical protein
MVHCYMYTVQYRTMTTQYANRAGNFSAVGISSATGDPTFLSLVKGYFAVAARLFLP